VNIIVYSTLALCAGFVVEMVIGAPQGWFHIIRAYGAVIAILERWLYRIHNRRLGGMLTVIASLIVAGVFPAAVTFVAWRISPWLYFAFETLFCWQFLATRCLCVESGRVYEKLKAGDLILARHAVSMIVGRDTDALDEKGVARAAVETVAENSSDGIAAPMLGLALGGSVLGALVKMVSTMDSMIGYKTERYIDFGRYAAKLDDAVMFIPARVCSWLMMVAAGMTGLDFRNAMRIYKRDRFNHASPNSAHTESVMAGALGVRLAGPAQYHGKLTEKPYIGDANREIEPEDIIKSHKLVYATSVLLLIISLAVRAVIYVTL